MSAGGSVSALRREKAKIVFLCIAAAVLYGVLHDQVTVRICPEYFTVAHPPYFNAKSATLLAFYWGVTGTIWVGAALGWVLARVSVSEGKAPIAFQRLIVAITSLFCIAAASATLVGSLAFELSCRSLLSIPLAVTQTIPATQHYRFIGVWWAHLASYVAAFLGGALLIYAVWRKRGKPSAFPLFPASPIGALRVLILATIVTLIIFYRLSTP